MMNDRLNLVLLVYSIYHAQLVPAMPDSSCDSAMCWDWNLDPLWGVIMDQFRKGTTPTTAPTTEDTERLYPKAPPAIDPTDEFEIITSPDSLPECKATLPGSGGSGSTGIHACEQAVGQLIWPRDCRNTEQNDRIAGMLSGMDGKYSTVMDPLCEGGVLYWFGRLTTDQISTLEADTAAVKAVIENPAYEFGKVNMKLGEAGAEAPVSPLEKRGQVRVVEQITQDDSLRFLSTAPGKSYSNKYNYFSEAGNEVRVYMIDKSFKKSPEFADSSIRYLYAVGNGPSETYDLQSQEQAAAQYQDGACVGSKILGRSKGVAKRASLVVVETKPHIASFVHALTLIITDIRESTWPSVGPRGSVVVNIRGEYKPTTREERVNIVVAMENLFRELVVTIEAVVVVSAGEVPGDPSGEIDSYPALFSHDYFLLTVGAVIASASDPNNGQLWPWSKGAHTSRYSARIFAPGDGWCMNDEGVEEWTAGQGISTAIVSGLAAYFLSLPDVGIPWREQRYLLKAIYNFFQRIGYQRSDEGPVSVWNGIDAEDEVKILDYWVAPKGGFPLKSDWKDWFAPPLL